MHLRRQVLRRRHPVAQGDGDRDDPLAGRHPGNHALDEVCRRLGHPPPGTRRAKPPPLAAEGHQQLVVARVTPKPQKAMREDATPQIIVEFALDIGRQARGIRVVRERGEKGLQVLRDHSVEHRMAGISGCVGGNCWRHASPHVQVGSNGSARSCHQLYCSFVQYTSKIFCWGEEGNTQYAPPCCCARAVLSVRQRCKRAFVFPIHTAWPTTACPYAKLRAPWASLDT